MTIFSVYIINKAGGLIYQYDHHKNDLEMEKTFRYDVVYFFVFKCSFLFDFLSIFY